MNMQFYNINDFKGIDLGSKSAHVFNAAESRAYDSAKGKQQEYDVFLSHSTKDAVLIRKIKRYLEEKHHLSAYIDWDEDRGTSRDDIADVVKSAMNISKSFLIVKTDNSDASSWVSWETGYFDNKDSNRIGVLLVEDEEKGFTYDTFHHQEYLKNYIILGHGDIVEFVRNGSRSVSANRMTYIDNAFKNNNIGVTSTGKLQILSDGSGNSTKFFGES